MSIERGYGSEDDYDHDHDVEQNEIHDVIVTAVSSDEYYQEEEKQTESGFGADGLATWNHVGYICCNHSGFKGWALFFLYILSFITLLFLFFFGIVLLGTSTQILGGCAAGSLLAKNLDNPFSAVMAGIIATSIFQSSAASNFVIASLVGNGLTVQQGIYLAMGSNVGNTVTNGILALSHFRSRRGLERAISGASVNDIFYMLAIAIFLPLEVASKVLFRLSEAIIPDELGTGYHFKGIIEMIIRPLTNKIIIANERFTEAFVSGDITSCGTRYPVSCENGESTYSACSAGLIGCDEDTGSCPAFFKDGATQKDDLVKGAIVFSVATAIVIFCMYCMAYFINRMLLATPVEVIAKVTNLNSMTSMAFGCTIGLFLGDASITESMLTPFVGTGIIELEQMFPWSLGSNVGFSLITMLAAISSGKVGFAKVALANLLFNVFAIILYFPLQVTRSFPLHGSLILGILSHAWRVAPLVYVTVTFFAIPLMLIGIIDLIQNDKTGVRAAGFIAFSLIGVLIIGLSYWWFFKDGRYKFLLFFDDDDENISVESSDSDSEGIDEGVETMDEVELPPAPRGILRNGSITQQSSIKHKLSNIGPKATKMSTKFKRQKRKKQPRKRKPPPAAGLCCVDKEAPLCGVTAGGYD